MAPGIGIGEPFSAGGQNELPGDSALRNVVRYADSNGLEPDVPRGIKYQKTARLSPISLMNSSVPSDSRPPFPPCFRFMVLTLGIVARHEGFED